MGIAAGGHASTAHLGGRLALEAGGAYGILQAAGLLLFSFAGHARIATMGEEVRDPQRTILRAIPIALFIALAIYLVVGVAALLAAGPSRLATATAPLARITSLTASHPYSVSHMFLPSGLITLHSGAAFVTTTASR